jgi:Ser/Thr protein kinase RdoA (MazF antagonist)
MGFSHQSTLTPEFGTRCAMENQTDLFLSLTPERVLEAVEAAGAQTVPICYPLNSFENRVYEVELADRTRVVAKFYRPGRWSREQILAEHAFLAELHEAEIPVCPVLPFADGETLRAVDGIPYCLFARRGGRAPDELTEAYAERLGMLTARLHLVGSKRPAESRLRLNGDTYVRSDLAWLEEHDTVPPHVRQRFVDAARFIADVADEGLEGVETIRLHGDLHLGNLLVRDDIFHVLDFDDMVVGPPVQDVWLILPGRDAWATHLRAVFLEAYERFREFDRSTLTLIEPLRGLRMVHYAAWLARRWHDPIFPRTWPHFGTERYWEEQTADLEDLVQAIREDRGDVPAPDDSAEGLTNKDYFWDLE